MDRMRKQSMRIGLAAEAPAVFGGLGALTVGLLGVPETAGPAGVWILGMLGLGFTGAITMVWIGMGRMNRVKRDKEEE